MSKSIVYYTCNSHKLEIELACRRQLEKAGLEIVSVSLGKKIPFGDKRLVLSGVKRSPETMHKQILLGLQESNTRFVFLCESDVLYHPSHFKFEPPNEDVFYFNTNIYKTWNDGLIVWTDDLQQVSGVCANRLLLLDFFHKRIQEIERHGFNRHYEPGERYGCRVENWQSEYPNIDIRHGQTLTKSHRKAEDFRDPKYAKGFKVVDSIPGWGDGMRSTSGWVF